MFRLKYSRSVLLPFLGQSGVVPLVLMRDRGKQGDGEWMEIELLQDMVDRV